MSRPPFVDHASPCRSTFAGARRTCSLLVAAALLLQVSFPAAWGQQPLRDPQKLESQEQAIARLIADLGANEFVRREEAQQRLLDIGLPAFDALAEAQDHPDIEIAERARYILRSLRYAWVEEEDDDAVRDAVRDYDASSISERRARIDRLAQFPSELSAGALSRIVRFEREPALSKQAALAVMSQTAAEDQREALAEALLQNIGSSNRDGAEWLRLYARTLKDPRGAADEWAAVVSQQRRLLAETSDRYVRDLVRDLMRWRAKFLMGLEHEQASDALAELLDLAEESAGSLLSTADWYLAVNAPAMVKEMRDRFAIAFENNLILKYRYAEALLQLGDQDAANAAAEEALQLHPDRDEDHRLAADSLQERGLHSWAEAEYLALLASHEPQDRIAVACRETLAELYHDQFRELEAAQTLQKIFDDMKDHPVIGEHLINPASSRGRMLLFYANHYGEQGDVAKQLEYLQTGLNEDSDEIDLLIAQHRFSVAHPEHKDFRERLMKKLQDTAQKYRQAIADFKNRLNDRTNPPQRVNYERALAMYNNQLAWLIANTEGDFDEAVSASQESLRLHPNYPGYLDTLGRCYYARGEYALAVKHQTRACELDPGALSMKRQLKLFQDALAESKKDSRP